MSDDTFYNRLRAWCQQHDAELQRTDDAFELIWRTSPKNARFIEIHRAPNGFAARAGELRAPRGTTVHFEIDKVRVTAWNCAPDRRLEQVLGDLHGSPSVSDRNDLAYAAK